MIAAVSLLHGLNSLHIEDYGCSCDGFGVDCPNCHVTEILNIAQRFFKE